MSAEVTRSGSCGTSTISDALDRLGLAGSAHGITPLTNGQRMAGAAFTVRYVTAGSPPGTVGDYIDEVGAGAVVVLDNAGRTDCTVWGDILTAVAGKRGVAGTAINGVCRDVHRALSMGYPIYSCGRFMRTGKDRVEVAEIGGVVNLGDVQVRPGDMVVGDDDGVVVVPAGRAEEVFALAAAIAESESAILDDALKHGSLRDARARHGYHTLQRRETLQGADTSFVDGGVGRLIRRRSVEVHGLAHGANPIPTGSRVGPLVCSSGIMGTDPNTGELPSDGREQVRLVFENLRAFLAVAQVGPEDLARVGVLLSEAFLRDEVNEQWLAMFPDPADRPARHTTVRELPGGMAVQLEVIAMSREG